MDNVLFYGDGQSRDEQRRQVRSAAAAYSHRHGPRKPKTGRHTLGGEPSVRKKPPPHPPRQKNAASSPHCGFASAASDTDAEHVTTATTTTTSADLRDEPLTRVVVPEAPPQSQTQTPVASNNDGTIMHRTSKSWEHAYSKFRVNGPMSVPQCAPAGQPHCGRDDLVPQQPATGEHAAARSPSRMLPQYSWTEYPRYSMTAQGFQSPEKTQDSKQKPGFAQQDLPQSWHVEGDRPILPPLHKGHPTDGHRPHSSEEMDMEFQHPLSQRAFLQFLDSTVHERALREARGLPSTAPG